MKGKRLLAQIALIAAFLFTSVISPNMVHANYGAPERWRDLPDYYIFKDTHGGGWSGSSGGLETDNGNLPVDWQETYEDLPSLRFNVTEPVSWVTSMHVMASWLTHDIHNYVPNGHLEFYVKGKDGGEQFQIGGDDNVARRDPVERVVFVPVSDYVTVTTEWQHVKIPLKDIYGNPDVPMDAKNARTIRLDRVNDEPFTVWINQLKITSPDKEPGFPEIKVNQVGFRNSVVKYAHVSGFEDEFTADVGTLFQVRRVSDDSVAYSGELILAKDYDVDSGERVLKAIFTDLQESGHYYITVIAEGIAPSLTFRIGDDVYRSLMFDVARYYLYQRSGMDLEEQYVPDFPRADITPMDTAAPFQSNPSLTKDVSKGWFDAGDKGKYLTAGTSVVTNMLWSYELFPDVYADNQFNIPESGNGIPDILDEARWGIEWILNMQDPVSGGFYAKVESMPSNDQRKIRDIRDDVVNLRPTNDTAFAAGALAHASLVYAEIDPDFAAQCLEAALAGWAYLEQNPDNIEGPPHSYASDSDDAGRLLAAGTLYRVTGESKYHEYFKNNYKKSANIFLNLYGDWVGTYNYAFYPYLVSENIDEEVVSWYKEHFTVWLNKSIDRYQTNAWNHTLNNGNFYWGSLNMILGTSIEALMGSMLVGTYNETVHNMGLAALNYVLGANPLRKSFVTGHGEDSLQTVYGIMNDDPRPGVPSGFMPLGPNKYNNPGISIFSAKNFMDSATEWTTNEHTIHSTSSLLFVIAFAQSDLAGFEVAPITEATISPIDPDGDNGWYKSDVTVSLTVDDNTSVTTTVYSLDGGATWEIYTQPVTFSQDDQYVVSYRSTTNSGLVEETKTIEFNLDSTGPEITVTGVEDGTYINSQVITPIITAQDNLSGVDDSKTTVTLNGEAVQQGETISLSALPFGYHTLVVTASDLAGNTSTKTIVFESTINIQSLKDLVTQFGNDGLITNQGIANSLQSQLSSNSLGAFVNHVKAQRGKHISVTAADQLIEHAQYLLSQTTGE